MFFVLQTPPDGPLCVNITNVITWLRFLKNEARHPQYANVAIPETDEEIEDAEAALLRSQRIITGCRCLL